MSDDRLEQDKKDGGNMLALGLPMGLPIGIGVGVALGVAMDNIAVGIAMGVGIGMAFSVAIGGARLAEEKKKSENADDQDANE
jgi:hypothetical protein